MRVSIYHNPRCSKSRQTLSLLEDRGISPEIVLYLTQPPSRAELAHVVQLLQRPVRDLLRKQEAEYKALGLDNPDLTDDQLLESLAANPKLLERPIVVTEQGAAIGRPPEAVLSLFTDN